MHDVFISYSRKDGDFVARVVGFFDEVGVTHWVDTADIEPAAVWREELQDAIIDADNVVFVISPHSLDSQECHRELRCATENHKRIVPAVYQPVRGDQPLPETLTRFQFLEVGTDDERAAFEKLALVIRDEFGWRKTGTDLLRRAENWRREQGGLLPRVELEDARVWLEHGAGMKPGPSALQVRFIHESEAHHLREAERWEELYATALARQLAAEAELLIDQRGVLLATGALLAIESMRRSPSVEGDRALRKALCLLPRPHAEVDYGDWSQLAATAFEPGAAHIAGIEKRGVLRVWSCTTGAELARFETEGARDLLMQPAHRRVVTVGDGVVVWSWPEGRALARFPDARGGPIARTVNSLPPCQRSVRRCSGTRRPTSRSPPIRTRSRCSGWPWRPAPPSLSPGTRTLPR